MIVDLLLNLVFGIVDFIIGLFPDAGEIATVESLGVSSYLGWLGLAIDMSTFSTVMGLILTAEAALMIVRLFVWIWGLIKP